MDAEIVFVFLRVAPSQFILGNGLTLRKFWQFQMLLYFSSKQKSTWKAYRPMSWYHSHFSTTALLQHNKISIFTLLQCSETLQGFGFQRTTKDLTNLWNICEFCTLERKTTRWGKKKRRKKNLSECFILSLIFWYVCVSLFSVGSLSLFFLICFIFWQGGGWVIIGNEGSDFSYLQRYML